MILGCVAVSFLMNACHDHTPDRTTEALNKSTLKNEPMGDDRSPDSALGPLISPEYNSQDGSTCYLNRKSMQARQLEWYNGRKEPVTAKDMDLEQPDVSYLNQENDHVIPATPSKENNKYTRTSRASADNNKFTSATRASADNNKYTSASQERTDNNKYTSTTRGRADNNKYTSATLTRENEQPITKASAKTAQLFSSTLKDQDVEPVISRNPVLNTYVWPYTKVEVSLDNDMFCNTDRYYTNGVHIIYHSSRFAFWQLNSLLPISKKNSMEYNSLELHHGMYTPFTTKSPPLLENDRPYSSTLYLRFARRSGNPITGNVQSASLDIGVIGKIALGSILQKGVHAGLPSNDEPIGWETQIANDLIINYNYELFTHIVSSGPLHAYSITSASLGTLQTSASAGLGCRLCTDRQFIPPLPSSFSELQAVNHKRWGFAFETNITGTVVGYNATLNGGLFNRDNLYTIEPEDMERLLFHAEAKFLVSFNRYGISLAQYYISNEFKEGKEHFWGQIGLQFGL